MAKVNINNTGMEFFTIEELCYSKTASIKGIANVPTKEVVENLRALVINVLDPLRRKWGKPIHVNSGYRCLSLNRAVGGASTSQHVFGQAADITVGDKFGNKKLIKMIIDSRKYDQVINENNYQWIHVSFKKNGENRRQALEKIGSYYKQYKL